MIQNHVSDSGKRNAPLEKRISDIEGNVEKRLTTKFNTVITDWIQNEVSKVKDDLNNEVQNIKEKVEKIEKSYAEAVTNMSRDVHPNSPPVNLNVITKNLVYDKREDRDKNVLNSNVLSLIKDELKLSNISVSDVSRKTSHSDSKPGVVVATLKDLDQKKSVLKAKGDLKKSTKFDKVFIENDLPLQQRLNNDNNIALLKALGKDKEFTIKSGHVVRKSDHLTPHDQGTNVNNGQVHNTRDINTSKGQEYTSRRSYDRNHNNRRYFRNNGW